VKFRRSFELIDAAGKGALDIGGVIVPVHRHRQGVADKE
jgi:hypothetical protein